MKKPRRQRLALMARKRSTCEYPQRIFSQTPLAPVVPALPIFDHLQLISPGRRQTAMDNLESTGELRPSQHSCG